MTWRRRTRHRLVLLVCAVVVTLLGATCSADGEVATDPGGTTEVVAPPGSLVPCGTARTVAYATHPGVDQDLTSLDLWLPPADAAGCIGRPLVVWVHGGAWTEGDKSEHVADKVSLFTGAGFAFASVNYRLTDPTIAPPAPRYPVHDQDTADAVAWLVTHAEEIGVDPNRIAVLGHSAGGGIVAAITTDHRYLAAHALTPAAVRCAASMDGEGYDITVGATHPAPEVQKIYRDAFSDDEVTWREASPLNHIAPDRGIPAFFVAARGGAVRVDLHLELIAALRAAGVPTTVLDARQLTHADLAVDVGAPGDTVVTPALMSFLGGCFDAAPDPAATATGS